MAQQARKRRLALLTLGSLALLAFAILFIYIGSSVISQMPSKRPATVSVVSSEPGQGVLGVSYSTSNAVAPLPSPPQTPGASGGVAVTMPDGQDGPRTVQIKRLPSNQNGADPAPVIVHTTAPPKDKGVIRKLVDALGL